MPNTHETLTSLFTDIADAIRQKTGGTDEIIADNFPSAISDIPIGGDVDVESLSVTENGTYTAPSGKAYSPVTVNVPQPSGSISITENGTYDVTSKASAVVNVSGGGATEPYIEETYNSSGALIGAVMHGYTKIRDYFFFKCYNLALTELPSGVTSIGANAFYECTNITLTELPSGVTSIGASAFRGCTSLTSMTFQNTPTTIHTSAFQGCDNLRHIYVPWAEGTVSSAPWGAKYATVHYNYTPAE